MTRNLTIFLIVTFCMFLPGTGHAVAGCTESDALRTSLDASDDDAFCDATRRNLDSNVVGTLNAWKNPKTGNAGTVQFILRYRSEGSECRKIWHTLRQSAGKTQVWEVNACKTDDAWALSQTPKPL